MQELWKLGLNWDDELPCNVQEKWIQLFTEMKELDGIGFKRCLVPPEADELPSLCVFADASQEAFGACAYIRQKTEENTYEGTFVAAKSRVAPEATHHPTPGIVSCSSRLTPREIHVRRK